MTKKEDVILVDLDDTPVGRIEKLAAHRLGYCHRAFSICIFRKKCTNSSDWQLLLQKRSEKKYHGGGLWSNTCCSHPRPGESTLDAGRRRLMMEMGMDVSLTAAGHFHYRVTLNNGLIEDEIDHVLLGFSTLERPNFNQDEVADVRWMDVTTLKAALIATPEQFTPWLLQALDIALYYDFK